MERLDFKSLINSNEKIKVSWYSSEGFSVDINNNVDIKCLEKNSK